MKLGDEQFAVADEWSAAGRLALCGIGVEPGLSDVEECLNPPVVWELGLDATAPVRVGGVSVSCPRATWWPPARPGHPRRQDARQDLRRHLGARPAWTATAATTPPADRRGIPANPCSTTADPGAGGAPQPGRRGDNRSMTATSVPRRPDPRAAVLVTAGWYGAVVVVFLVGVALLSGSVPVGCGDECTSDRDLR